MHLLFVDESGTPPKPGRTDQDRYFVIGGVIVPEGSWHRTKDKLLGLKARWKLRGELKWRYFAPGNEDARNPMRGLPSEQRNSIRSELFKVISGDGTLVCLACVADAQAAYSYAGVNNQDDLYNGTYKPITERFQYYLQDLSKRVGRKELGIVVADHRGAQDDKRLRQHHERLLHSSSEFTSKYKNLVEGLFVQPSNLSVGIQLADLVAGAVWRHAQKGDSQWFDLIRDSFRRSNAGLVDGYGLVRFPKHREDAG
jgi:hypothetical protein